MITFEHQDDGSDVAEPALSTIQYQEHVAPQWPIAFGCMPRGTYLDPTDQEQFHSLFIPARQWSAYVSYQILKLQRQLRDTFRMGPHNEKWLQEHESIRQQIDHLLDGMQQALQHTRMLRDAMMRHDYHSRLFALNTRIQEVPLQAMQENLELDSPVWRQERWPLQERGRRPAESRQPSSTQMCQTRQRRKQSPLLVIGQDPEGHGEGSQNKTQHLRRQNDGSDPTESYGQLALRKVQLRRAEWERSRQSHLMESTGSEHQGKKKPKKGKFKRERQAAEGEVRRLRQEETGDLSQRSGREIGNQARE
ncbi:hypothetical protein PFICI_02095 [Pestalotiopsis fici W106-1]|uniref:Uncharacterized protein n=1 Tax=Pestalotiopsis fici (strain W106-1 / CGMCC3.15140) TaxID=1229662 RepID=W3XRY4_PESFW|nr:uncharacterized protein PFICI_02095 [Pestalotiopsis fici W106-1]ETS88267.1 hypothetical protein PFICI_02095 [Pestalotiopsis fici W106-1]